MAKIKLRLRKNGEPSYTLEVRVCGVQSSKTFHNKKDAQIWRLFYLLVLGITLMYIYQNLFNGSTTKTIKHYFPHAH